MKTVNVNQLAATVKADMERWQQRQYKQLDNALMRCGLVLEAHAKRTCPVDTGTLRASLHTVRVGRGVVEVRDGVNYGAFVEFGTSKMRANPFMRRAIYSSEGERAMIMKEALQDDFVHE